jgi:hypothetical protein
MNTMKALMAAAGLMISTTGWSAVAVHESAAAKEQMNYIREGNFSSGTAGGLLPKPWRCSENTERARVTVESPAGRPEAEWWVRLVDDSDKENANIRQSFAPVRSGRFQARLISNKDGGRLFFNLGSGSAARPEERAVQLGINSDGLVVVQGKQRLKTSMQIKPREVYLVRCDFEPISNGKALRVTAELVEEQSQTTSRVESEVETSMAITAVRVTSTGPDTGVDYYVTDLSLTGR